jgi:hypothetical protein
MKNKLAAIKDAQQRRWYGRSPPSLERKTNKKHTKKKKKEKFQICDDVLFSKFGTY